MSSVRIKYYENTDKGHRHASVSRNANGPGTAAAAAAAVADGARLQL